MRKNENIARFSADKIRRKIARGDSKTDWKRVDAMSQAEVERLADKDEGPLARLGKHGHGWTAARQA